MAQIAGAPAGMMVGGKTSSGPKTGIYAVKVKSVVQDVSTKKGTPFIALELVYHKDENHPDKDGKKLLTQRFYGPNPETSVDDQQAAAGRLKNSLFKPLDVKWPDTAKPVDDRLFLNKEFYVFVAPERKPQEGQDARVEVRRIAKRREDLEKLLASEVESASEAEEGEKAAKPKARGGR